MGLPGWVGWTEAPVSTVAWAALDSVDSKMRALKHREYQDQSVGGVHRLVWLISPALVSSQLAFIAREILLQLPRQGTLVG
jgi:hypothetical protein